MPVPDFQAVMLPVLQLMADQQPHKVRELVPAICEHFQLTQEERDELLPSGVETKIHNRTSWAIYDMFKAGLLTRPSRGYYQLSVAGQQLLANPPAELTRNYLMQFDVFKEWQTKSNQSLTNKNVATDVTPSTLIDPNEYDTPEELIADAYKMVVDKLADELLTQVKQVTPSAFERLVTDLMLAMGYGGSREGAGQVTQASNDGGIDGLINEDRLGLDVIYLQAKRYSEQSVGRPAIQEFVGALAGHAASKGVFITTSTFTKGAVEFARMVPQKVILIDGERLSQLMIEHNLGVSIKQVYQVKRIDSDFFEQD